MTIPSPNELREAREQFRDLLNDPRSREAQWQKLFAACPYILSMSLPLRLMPEDVVPLGRPGKTEPDLVFYPRHRPRTHTSYGAIELKRPQNRLLKEPRKNVITLSDSATTAVGQAKSYLRAMATGEFVEVPSGNLFVGTPAYAFVVMGLSEELQRGFVQEFLNDPVTRLLPANFRILPYDTLLEMFEANVPTRFMAVAPEPARSSESAGSIEAGGDDEDEDEDPFYWGYMGPSHDDY